MREMSIIGKIIGMMTKKKKIFPSNLGKFYLKGDYVMKIIFNKKS